MGPSSESAAGRFGGLCECVQLAEPCVSLKNGCGVLIASHHGSGRPSIFMIQLQAISTEPEAGGMVFYRT